MASTRTEDSPRRSGEDFPPEVSAAPATGDGRDRRFIPGSVLAGRYRLVALLGRGGMGEVYRAEDLKLGQTVALKFLPAALASDPGRLARFFNEVRTARQVTHANVCRIHDIDEAEGQHFISMEYVDGEDLASLLRRIGRVPKERAIGMARQLCAGLAAAHERGIVHRDLKPSNVMVDGRGRIRITDFGLAGLGDEIAADHARAGTPAYMAPEQLQGAPASVKTDIYALGLVLYEIFTGKPAFGALSRAEQPRLRTEATPSSPSSLVEGFDPAVERVILRCLERDAARRPNSVLGVAAALPGGDPLAAALAAGETPSPEMVADAGKRGGVRPALGLLYLALILMGLVVNILMTGSSDFARVLRLPFHPEYLSARAGEILRNAGFDPRFVDRARGLTYDFEHIQYVRDRDSSLDRWAKLAASVPAPVLFWYRASPSYITPVLDSSRITRDEPPNRIPGMVTLTLDAAGRLLGFSGVPGNGKEEPTDGGKAGWAPFFRAADLDAGLFHPTSPEWHLEADCEDRRAWLGAYKGREGVPIRVEACASGGSVTAFRVLPPWRKPASARRDRSTLGLSIFVWSVFCLGGLLVMVAALLARRNLRAGRGDREGAYRLSLFVFIVTATGSLLTYHYAPVLDIVPGLLTCLAKALLVAMVLWLLYLALEPYARRLWPGALVSWSRILAGRFRDPLVGRDVLLGALFGTLVAFLDGSRGYLLPWAGIPDPFPHMVSLDGLMSQRETVAGILGTLTGSLLAPAALVFVLVILRSVTRRPWVAGASLVVLLTLLNSVGVLFSEGAAGRSATLVVLILVPTILSAVLQVYLIVRFGFLAAIASILVPFLGQTFPVTLDLGSWQAGAFLTANLLAFALCAWAFAVARAGRPLFSGELAEA